jgi:hypothetical protein
VSDIPTYFCPITIDAELLRNLNFKPRLYQQDFKTNLSRKEEDPMSVFIPNTRVKSVKG